MRRVAYAAGLITGYVLGARAGRDRYEQLAKSARRVTGHPAAVRARAEVKRTIRSGFHAVVVKIGLSHDAEDAAVIDGTA